LTPADATGEDHLVNRRKTQSALASEALDLIDDDLLTTKEVAKIRRKSESALRSERLVGDGPPFIIDGAKALYPRAGLEAWLRARLKVPTDRLG
jgi:hypothetical protein